MEGWLCHFWQQESIGTGCKLTKPSIWSAIRLYCLNSAGLSFGNSCWSLAMLSAAPDDGLAIFSVVLSVLKHLRWIMKPVWLGLGGINLAGSERRRQTALMPQQWSPHRARRESRLPRRIIEVVFAINFSLTSSAQHRQIWHVPHYNQGDWFPSSQPNPVMVTSRVVLTFQ